ncbi:MAG: beta-lactamase family protein [Bacteroidales bacterium]|nr:beta-lactamase family protein [Bacteroidales bacterium]MBQ9722304.1 beta-lactamase family protein [Bacteroidales bacterium]
MKKTSALIIAAIAVAVVATATIVIKTPLSKPAELAPDRVKLNEILTNDSSEFAELNGLDRKVEAYMRRWELKGASLAITRNDSLLYAKGYGWADEEMGVKMEPSHIMRMASVSKLITAAGIMVLQDRDSLSIKDTVFGPSGILSNSLFTSVIKDKNHHKITVEHLLRHQGGFYRDPLFSSRDVKHQMQLDVPPVKEDFYRLVLGRKLSFMPGTWQRYSNFGYLLLSEIIEKVSGMPYEEFIRTQVLAPAGCYDMHIGGNYYADKRENEVRYYTHNGDGKYIEDYSDNGEMVERCYGGNNIPLLSGAGAWCASPAEIARLVASIDGRPEVPDIISQEAFEQMIEYFDKDTFSLGWNDTAPEKGWSRTGTLSGTCALVRQFPDGECWVMITNTSTYRGPGQARYTEALFKQCRELYSSKLPERNLFYK